MNTVAYPKAEEHGKVRLGFVPVRTAPNHRLQATPNSLRSSVAPAIGRA